MYVSRIKPILSRSAFMNRQLFNNFYSGLSGIQLPVPRYEYPPEYQQTSRLTYYATQFNSIEINSSFYKIPMASTVARWAGGVPEGFRFTFKLFREITHNKDLEFKPEDVSRFIKTIASAGEKSGCLLIQFPPSLGNVYNRQLADLLNNIKTCDTDNRWKVAVEFRNKSWYNEATFELLSHFRATLVKHDIPKSATPPFDPDVDFIYVRFHGPEGNYGGSYSEEVLQEYAEYVREWLGQGKTVYVYFNNTKGDAFDNCKTFNRFVAY